MGCRSLRFHLSRRPARLLRRVARQRGALSRGTEGRCGGEIAVLCLSTRRRQYRTDAGQTPPQVVVQCAGSDRAERLLWWLCRCPMVSQRAIRGEWPSGCEPTCVPRHSGAWDMSSTSTFFFNDTATTEIYTLSLHDALPLYRLSAIPRSISWDDVNRVLASV